MIKKKCNRAMKLLVPPCKEPVLTLHLRVGNNQ
uniref:Uncharacterized protein n=1 Tax=Anguilla anguilla TaxID=7936 RepID=A0A0E9V715_ANGAN